MDLKQAYLGDGVYAERRDGNLRLYTSDGVTETNTIWLEEDVYKRLLDFVAKLKAKP